MEAERRYAARHGRGFEYSRNYEQERANFDRQRAQFRTTSSSSSGSRLGSAAAGSLHASRELLGVRAGCSRAELKRAYYALAKQHHPDSATTAGADFARLKDAYDELLPHAPRCTRRGLFKIFLPTSLRPAAGLGPLSALARRVHHDEPSSSTAGAASSETETTRRQSSQSSNANFTCCISPSFLTTLRCFLPLGCESTKVVGDLDVAEAAESAAHAAVVVGRRRRLRSLQRRRRRAPPRIRLLLGEQPARRPPADDVRP